MLSHHVRCARQPLLALIVGCNSRAIGLRQPHFSKQSTRQWSKSTILCASTKLPPRPKIDDNDIEENFLKGSGPGGQKINKTSSAVQLIHIPTGIVVKCQATRSRIQNRKLARQLLADKLDEKDKGTESRAAIKTERAKKKKASGEKKRRRKYRALEEEKKAQSGQLAEKEIKESEDNDLEEEHRNIGIAETKP